MQDFKKLSVWEKSHSFVLEVYKINFPPEELYGINSQIRRASLSIPTNIAEGCGRDSNADLKRFLQIAFGSACEVEYLLVVCRDLGYIDDERYMGLEEQIREIKKMLAGFIVKLRK